MKYGVLLIGFEYIKTKRWKTLPGIPADLYQVYRHCNPITKNILVFTDVDKDYKTSVLQRAILDGYVDSNLLSFIEDTKDRKHHKLYKSQRKSGYTVNNFDKTIGDFIEGFDRLVIYYTGHGKDGDIILPDNTHVSLDYFRDLVVSNVNPTCQVIIILDCCQSNGMSLPYSYSDGNYHLNSRNFIKPHIVCISSTQLDEDSAATRSGSLFTRVLFGYLYNNQNQMFHINNLLKHLGNINDGEILSTITIYSSYPNIKLLWPWFTKNEYNNLDVSFDHNNSLITVTLNNCQRTIDKSSSMSDYIRYHHNGRHDTIY